MSEILAIHFIVIGKVQGVGFRYATREKANQLSLMGWVRNLSNGSVEGVAQGNTQKLQVFQQWLKTGPAFSHVNSVDVREISPQEFSGFAVTR